MVNVTDEALLLRVEALLDAIPEIKTIIRDEDCPLSDADLPAVLVMVRGGTRRNPQLARDSHHLDRAVWIGAYLSRLCDGSLADQRARMLEALRLSNVIPDYFARLNRLELNGRPLDGIDQPSLMTDQGLETRPLLEDVYYACTYEFIVPSQRT